MLSLDKPAICKVKTTHNFQDDGEKATEVRNDIS